MGQLITLNVPKLPEAMLNTAKQFTHLAENYLIDSPELKAIAVNDIREIKRRWEQMENFRVQQKKPLDDYIENNIQGVCRPILAALKQAAETIRKKLDDYIDKEENEARKAREEASRVAMIEAEVLVARAAEIANEGRVEEARAIEQVAGMTVAMAVMRVPEVEKTQGSTRKTIWSATCVDKMKLITAVCGHDRTIACLKEIVSRDFDKPQIIAMLNGLIKANAAQLSHVPLACLDVNQTFLNAQARALRGEMSYPGVQVTEEKASSFSKK